MLKQCKVFALNENAAVVIRFTDGIVKDYVDCKEKAAVPDGPGKNCKKCSLDIPGDIRNCLLTMLPEIDEELEKRKAEKDEEM